LLWVVCINKFFVIVLLDKAMNVQFASLMEHHAPSQSDNPSNQQLEAIAMLPQESNEVPDGSRTGTRGDCQPLARAVQPPLGSALPDRAQNDDVIDMRVKVCVKCKQEKTVLEFHKNSRSSDGLHSYCKDCNRAQALAHIKAEKARKALIRAAKKNAAGKV